MGNRECSRKQKNYTYEHAIFNRAARRRKYIGLVLSHLRVGHRRGRAQRVADGAVRVLIYEFVVVPCIRKF